MTKRFNQFSSVNLEDFILTFSQRKYKQLYNKCILSRRSEQTRECCSLRLVTNALIPPTDWIGYLEGYTHNACRNRTTYLKSIIQDVCLQIGPLVSGWYWTTSVVLWYDSTSENKLPGAMLQITVVPEIPILYWKRKSMFSIAFTFI